MSTRAIDLQNVQSGEKKSFRFDHAERMLVHQTATKQWSWKLPGDSNYAFVNGKLNHKSGDRKNQIAEKPKGDTQGSSKETAPQTTHGSGDGNGSNSRRESQ